MLIETPFVERTFATPSSIDVVSPATLLISSVVKPPFLWSEFDRDPGPEGGDTAIDPFDALAAMKELDNKYIGTRTVKIKRSHWTEKQIDVKKAKGDR